VASSVIPQIISEAPKHVEPEHPPHTILQAVGAFPPLVERWRELVEAAGLNAYQSTERWLLRIDCESGGNPDAYNSAGPFLGLLQILNGSPDPQTNLEQAKTKWESQGAGAWPHC